MPKKERIAEVHFYEWHMAAWAMSETRGRLLAAGRGIYRELLDYCFGQGKFPDDIEWICRQCACSKEEFEATWLIIKKHFPISKRGAYRHNKRADTVRAAYFRYTTQQKRNRKMGIVKHNTISEIRDGGSTMSDSVVNGGSTKNKNKIKDKNKEKEKNSEPPTELGSLKDPYDWFIGIWTGPIPEDCWRVFPAAINTPDRLTALQTNTPLWIQTKKYRDGFTDANSYLKSGVWLRPPKDELLTEARASPWRSQETRISATEEMT